MPRLGVPLGVPIVPSPRVLRTQVLRTQVLRTSFAPNLILREPSLRKNLYDEPIPLPRATRSRQKTIDLTVLSRVSIDPSLTPKKGRKEGVSMATELAEGAKADHVVAYLPKEATEPQREALLAWLKATVPGLDSQKFASRTVSLKFSQNETACDFSAGDFVSVKSASMESCAMGGCGESLWYTPRAKTSIFTVAVDRASQISEPLLQLKWQDGGKRNIFLARFGDKVPTPNLYVSTAELCAPGQRLF